MLGVPAVYWALAGIAGAACLACLGGGYWYGTKRATSKVFEEVEDVDGGNAFKAFDTDDAGILGTYLAERKRKKALGEGFVRWHLVNSSFSEPMYVSPEYKAGGNTPELEHEGTTYLFPKSAMVPSEEEGVPTIVHRKGESDPIDLRDDWDLALDAATLTEYLTQRVTSDKPGGLGLGGLGDMDSMQLLRYGVLAMIGLFLILELLGGGIA